MTEIGDIIDNQIRELEFMYNVLFEDCRAHMAIVKKDPTNQIWSRSFIRSSFAWVEGVIFQMRKICLFLAVVLKMDLSKEEKEALMQSYGVPNEKGKKRRYPQFHEGVKFAFKMMSKVSRNGFELNCSGKEWQEFIAATEIRDRLMHPKTAKDLIINDVELALVANATAWLVNNYAPAMQRLKKTT